MAEGLLYTLGALVIWLLGWLAHHIKVSRGGDLCCALGLHDYHQYMPSPRLPQHGYQTQPPNTVLLLPSCRVCRRCGHMPDLWRPSDLEEWMHWTFSTGNWEPPPALPEPDRWRAET